MTATVIIDFYNVIHSIVFVPRHDGSRRRRRLPGHKLDPVADNIATNPNENN